MGTTAVELPRWDMASIFGPEPDAAETAFAAALHGIDELVALFDRLDITPRDDPTIDDATVAALETVIAAANRVGEAATIQYSYLAGTTAADMGNDAAQAALSELMQAIAKLMQLQARMTAWIGSLDVEALISASQVAREHACILRDAVADATHLMSPAEEALAAELAPSGAFAWFQMQQQIDASLTAEFEVDGEVVTLPLTEIERYFSDPDRTLRRRAYEVNRETMHAVRVPLAAALNGVKGEQITLTRRRKWDNPLDAALRLNRIDRATLDAMMDAITSATPDLRRYLRAKAKALGLPKLASYDLFAPVGETAATWPYDDAVRFVTAQFATYSPALAALAERSTAERWIDAGPREGKVGGGFCTGVGDGVSRILLNYTPNFVWMCAVAHELGHAYHVHALHQADRAFLQQAGTPATLAETASTFCETLVQVQALAHAADTDRLELLNGVIQGQVMNVFLTGIGYATEQAIFAARQERQLSPDELTEITLTAQGDLFGAEIDSETLWRYQWASVPHYYMPDIWYYNFPYAFGMLFGLGLYATYRADPEPFIAGFDALLADTGMADAAELAARFGIDLHAPSFWEAGLATIRANIVQFEELVESKAP